MPGRPSGSARLSADTFAAAAQRVISLVAAHHEKQLEANLWRLEPTPLIILYEVS